MRQLVLVWQAQRQGRRVLVGDFGKAELEARGKGTRGEGRGERG
eukprot:COSAG02_NODE_628_length_19343_cov_15.829297_7_plen_44_part_00